MPKLLALAADLFESVGTVIKVLDTDGTSSVENVEGILRRLIRENKADAFYTCGSNRLLQLMKRIAKALKRRLKVEFFPEPSKPQRSKKH